MSHETLHFSVCGSKEEEDGVGGLDDLEDFLIPIHPKELES